MKLIILDRDGVINEDSDAYIKSPEEWIPIPGSLEAIARLYHAGWTVVIASNQSGVGRGLFDEETLERIHAKLDAAVGEAGGEVDAIYYCPHSPEEECHCRKPKPGLLHAISLDYDLSLHGVPAVGDSLRDLQAAHAVGARPILVRTGKGKRTLTNPALPADVPVYDDLAAVADALLAEEE